MGRHDILILLAFIVFMFVLIRAGKTYVANGGHLSFSFKPAWRGLQSGGKRVFGDLTAWWDGAKIRRNRKNS
jgi:hypothetical protein